MTSLIERVYKSRNTIRDIYKDYEWDASSIPDLLPKDLESMFNVYNTTDSSLLPIGDGLAFTLKLPHMFIEDHNLVVIYYNISNDNEKQTKTTRSIVDRIKQLYETDYINTDDQLLVLVNDPQNESLHKLNHMISHEIKNDYTYNSKFNKYIYDPNNHNEDSLKRYNENIFRHCVLLSLDIFQINILKHELVPKHEIIYDKRDIKDLYKKYNMTEQQIPVISKLDIISKIIRLCIGDVCKIIRQSKTSGDSLYFRICR
jgi:DNA-directed RNA polymerase subunit H (RpoH/RPB5)